ncbi:MAG: DUF2835 domain-containing protein [Pseudomonadales bacterium]
MRRYEFDLCIPADELLRYYRGSAASVQAIDRYGRRLRFPAAALRPFVSGGGVRGTFVMVVGEDNRLKELARVR